MGGHRPPTWALFSENGCENERIGSRALDTPPRFTNGKYSLQHKDLQHKRFDLIILGPDSFASNGNRSTVVVDRLTITLLFSTAVFIQSVCGEQKLQAAYF